MIRVTATTHQGDQQYVRQILVERFDQETTRDVIVSGSPFAYNPSEERVREYREALASGQEVEHGWTRYEREVLIGACGIGGCSDCLPLQDRRGNELPAVEVGEAPEDLPTPGPVPGEVHGGTPADDLAELL